LDEHEEEEEVDGSRIDDVIPMLRSLICHKLDRTMHGAMPLGDFKLKIM
jgi:hypothetical protein